VSAEAKAYLPNELHVQTSLGYLELDVNFNWNWRRGDPKPPLYIGSIPDIAALMKQQVQTRSLVVDGDFDLAVPVLGLRSAINQGGVPLTSPRRLY
jgi:hypothetical protein